MYTINVLSKQFSFDPHPITVNADITNILITAQGDTFVKPGLK